ncbi:hypothetical protein IE077_002046 [Cardiosporidium cionae]|uniref:Trafficking protein particle complex subunit 13 N-terminal domain-containing protein n=1 Tax=Cardiosporidium cionae TaxID=476202 RepID=A0ABQ7JBP1_9APIC|nr:hypothetical protein IE077_002046 [Cardiosporidium cionae]|eukprot:KAF8821423.1 hypothetical protein IE077_002046 [Cardiosporidium cionae]
MARAATKEDILTLRVMRLTNPILEPALESYLNPNELFDFQTFPEGEKLKNYSEWKDDPIHSLVLPTEQEEIYSGENFRAFIRISNLSDEDAFSVTAHIQMRLEEEFFTLYDISSTPIDRLAVLQNLDFPIQYPVKYSGSYTLVCNFSYTVYPSCELISQKRSFQFSAKLPFSFSYFIDTVAEENYIQCLIENTSSRPFLLTLANIMSSAELSVQRRKSDDAVDSP